MMQLLAAVVVVVFAGVPAQSYLYSVPSQKLQTPLLIVKTPAPPTQPAQLQQYFTQDSYGQYSYGYSEPLSTKQEVRTLDGITRGSYSYIDANGLLQTVDYTADADGFHVAATNLPIDHKILPTAVTETPEVAAAREQHLAAHKALLQGDASSAAVLPQSVTDTPEVMAAKKEFFARYAAEEEKHKSMQKFALLKSQGLVVPSVEANVPLAAKRLYANVAQLSANVKTQNQVDKLKGSHVKYGIQYAVPSNLARFYLPVA